MVLPHRFANKFSFIADSQLTITGISNSGLTDLYHGDCNN